MAISVVALFLLISHLIIVKINQPVLSYCGAGYSPYGAIFWIPLFAVCSIFLLIFGLVLKKYKDAFWLLLLMISVFGTALLLPMSTLTIEENKCVVLESTN